MTKYLENTNETKEESCPCIDIYGNFYSHLQGFIWILSYQRGLFLPLYLKYYTILYCLTQ